jgi:hypothetical protein
MRAAILTAIFAGLLAGAIIIAAGDARSGGEPSFHNLGIDLRSIRIDGCFVRQGRSEGGSESRKKKLHFRQCPIRGIPLS